MDSLLPSSLLFKSPFEAIIAVLCQVVSVETKVITYLGSTSGLVKRRIATYNLLLLVQYSTTIAELDAWLL